ncbi:hypothetical protein JR316_0008606 [Psilocybe cubensis]|uniref:Uncharacterized protein n=3 Tax=Psilocybe cubensis TaxID=181762 RepID=A0A8H7XVH6_PSICU|nr:uncharacterized protein JR316_0013518 [Psilocybe cubensis]XP_047745778.1 hypothetical protein JR316_0008606 [Psilocybe cubensis]KAH9474203.1 hypothetical protein JR316_0013518 [Psilocybe cubensis]KAH9478153.1 hypothetical protein JR316_0008606 [Psilocybe cubensis]
MTTPNLSVPVNVENYAISSNLNSSMTFNLLMDFSLQWYYLNWSIVVNGSTRNSIFVASLSSPTWLHIFNEFLFNLLFVVSDALLIWRCYHVWGQSIKMISISLIFLTAELALSLTSTIFDGTSPILATKARETLSNNISTALAFVSLGTTFSATFLIGYRVHILSNSHVLSFKSFYNRIVLIVIESAALYSLVFLFWGIILVIPIFHNLESPLVEVVPYVEIVLTVGAGLAPTVMVARLALEEPETSHNCSTTVPPISNLYFNHQYGSAGSSQDVIASAVLAIEKSVTTKDVHHGIV